MRVLVINCGSSSVKAQLLYNGSVIAKILAERIDMPGTRIILKAKGKETSYKFDEGKNHEEALGIILGALTNSDPEIGVIESLDQIDAVGHRILHGGELFKEPTLIDDNVIAGIKKCTNLAPLHIPANLLGIKACRNLMPNTPQVAVFDTAFHQTMPESSFLYAIPRELYEKHGIRKYGFHGTSHEYLSKTLRDKFLNKNQEMKLITCHLGQGASLCAINDKGKCIDTTMGLTPMCGVIMGTRCGDIDPSIIPFMEECLKVDGKDVVNILNKKSGLLALCGSSDVRDILKSAQSGDERAKFALEKFTESIAENIAKLVIKLKGVKQIVFSGGIGENSDIVRGMICDKLEIFNVYVDSDRNLSANGRAMKISHRFSLVDVFVIPTNEEVQIYEKTVEIVETI